MAGKSAVTREEIVEAAYERARSQGLASLSVRAVAGDCGVAVGTLYNYFPDKSSLVTEVIERFWENVAFGGLGAPGSIPQDVCFAYREGENLVGFCRRVADTLADAVMEFQDGWLAEISTLDGRTKARGLKAERACFAHIEANLEQAIEHDHAVNAELLAQVGAAPLARFIWRGIYESLRAGDRSCSVLFALLEHALY